MTSIAVLKTHRFAIDGENDENYASLKSKMSIKLAISRMTRMMMAMAAAAAAAIFSGVCVNNWNSVGC